jgi:hypothetical protein
VCGDEVYGACTQLREFCEHHDQAYVLRVPSNFRLTLTAGGEAVLQASGRSPAGQRPRLGSPLRRSGIER